MKRHAYLALLKKAFKINRVVALLGPRQCGKTTLARDFFKKEQDHLENYFDLENPQDLQRLNEPLVGLEDLQGLIVIDEIQRRPDLFSILRVLVDAETLKQHYLILGSASRELIKQSSESLAGRLQYIELTPFSYEEYPDAEILWIRGGFPLSCLAESDQDSFKWRLNYIRTFLEQDIPNLGINIPSENLRRFWMMLAHYHGQVFNASEIGNSLGFSHHTIQKYLDILSGTFMVRQLAPWYENIGKRQVKSKKIYFRDSGIFHTLLNIQDKSQLLQNPKLGVSWEGFALESVIRHLGVDTHDCYFWATHSGAELDLLVVQGMQRLGFEFKFSKAPILTPSMKVAIETLKLEKLIVIYPGEQTIKLSREVQCVGLRKFLDQM